MARFYARFDSGSESTLDNDYFDKRRISTNSASGAQFRDGLIASRSAVSADVYDDLDSANKTPTIGTYFPPDAATFPTSTLLSWSTAYTSSVLGIKTPTSNTYGGGGAINYSQRPTASILSTMTAFVTKSVPNDPVQLNFDVYKSASNAVTATLNQIQNGAGTAQTPSTRTSYDTSRTYFSLWNDPTMNYFAWDDFTPGVMSTSGMGITANMADCTQTASPGATSTIQFTWSNTLSYQFKNDGNPSGRIGVEIEISKASGATGTCDTNWNVARFRLLLGYGLSTHGGPLTMGTSTSGNGPANPFASGNCTGTSTWTWNGLGGYNAGGTPNVSWTVKLEDCISPGYDINVSARIYDAIITDSSIGNPGVIATQAANPNVP